MAAVDRNSDVFYLELVQYLERSRAAVQGTGAVTVVMGNEAADLDSCVSAITYAFLLDREGGATSPPVVPLINIPRGDFVLRPDAVTLLTSSRLEASALLFEEEVDLSALKHASRLAQLVLVDHNRIASRQEQYLPHVVEIVDHHVDEKMYPETAKTHIALVGSCCTLVAKAFQKRYPQALASPTLRRLLKAGILLDSGYLDRSKGRTTDLDEEMAELLGGRGEEARALHKELNHQRHDISAMPTWDLLRKDYKQWALGGPEEGAWQVGVSSIGMDLLQMALKDPNMSSTCSVWSSKCQLDLLVLMGSYSDSDKRFFRQLAFVPSPNCKPSLLPRLVAFFQSNGVPVEPIDLPNLPEGAAAYQQLDTTLSRKKIQPVLVKFFNSHEAPASASES
eukprot:CAMPEP_0198207718 /NCGR_PEP_ID=MMETSP1445-20131203/11151_1 /TAXON_ID=36898 /ORGANISM="Pyramimonas sp., Strain CCMP2087" /LENGTH=393 /DNA_ID=CAMNT_0043880855 /DNA_START=243 /DNA_END=1424 /DNA_ORIENTATION=+